MTESPSRSSQSLSLAEQPKLNLRGHRSGFARGCLPLDDLPALQPHGDRDAMLAHGIPEWPVRPEGGSG